MCKKNIRISFLVVTAFLTTLPAFAQVPHLINYQGKLTDAQDNPVTGSHAIVFSIYQTATGGAAVWTENYPSVAVTAGLFNVLLGSVTPLNLPFDRDYYLGVKIGNDAEMTPRKRIVSVATAFRAENAANAINATKLEGKAANDFAATTHLHDDRYYTEAELNGNDGSPPNTGSNRMHWNNLLGVPAGFVDGVDNEGSGAGGDDDILRARPIAKWRSVCAVCRRPVAASRGFERRDEKSGAEFVDKSGDDGARDFCRAANGSRDHHADRGLQWHLCRAKNR